MLQRWTLPGLQSSYLVVTSGDKEALSNHPRVPLWSARASLEHWLTSSKPTLQAIYGFLVGSGSSSSRTTSEDSLRRVLSHAFETSRLVVLENIKVRTLNEVVVIGHTVQGIPFDAQGQELQVLIAMKMGGRTREQALALIQSGTVPALSSATNSGKGSATLTLSPPEYDILKGIPPRVPAASARRGPPPATDGSGQGASGIPPASPWTPLIPPSAEQRKSDALARERLKTRLYGLEAVFIQYKAYCELKKSLERTPSKDEFGIRDPYRSPLENSIKSARDALTIQLRRNGFSSIEDFEDAIEDYANAFQKETVANGMDLMSRYDQVLEREGANYQNADRVTHLYQALKATGARDDYEQAALNGRVESRLRTPDLRYLPNDRKMMQEAHQKKEQLQARAEAKVNKVAKDHPLLSQNDFKKEELAYATPEEAQRLMRGYIQARRRDIRKAWNELAQRPECIYSLDKLLESSLTIQEIPAGSICELIIRKRAEDLLSQAMASKLLMTLIALVVGLFTFGQGTVAIIAATVSLGISAYAALEEFRQYEVESAQHGAQLLSDDPSLAWVIVAMLGLGLDLAGAASALKGMRNALKTFNHTSDLPKLEKSLEALSGIDEKIRKNVLKAAQAELSYRAAIKRLFPKGAVLRVSLLGAEQVGGLMVVVYHLARRGVLAFDHFLLELKALNILADINKLTPEELTRLKQLFDKDQRIVGGLVEEGKTLGLTDDQIESFIKQYQGEKRLTPQQLKERMRAQSRPPHPEKPTHPTTFNPAGKPLQGPRVPWRNTFGTDAEAVIKAVLARSRATTEALGELGLEVAMRRLGIQSDPRFIARYHGMDSLGVEGLPLGERIGVDSQRRLVGMEAKGAEVDSTALNTHTDGPKQLSWKANKKFAQKMLGKAPKVGKPSKRQGGAYTHGEMELYDAIDLLEGRKRLISTHVNVKTGQVRVVERDGFGAIAKTASPGQHDFVLEGLSELLEIFKKRYGK